MKNHKPLRRSGIKIMAGLIALLGSLAYIMILAVINGSLGFISAMGVTVFGAIGVAKALGESVAMSYGLIIGLAVGCGALRGILRYFEQYSNHFIAFKLLATLRDKIFKALRRLCPAKLESKKKGSIIAMITSDIETLEVFYAHTVSPICIAILVSLAVAIFVGVIGSPYLSLVALAGYLTIGIVLPLISSKLLKKSGVEYRKAFSLFNAYFMDSIKGIKDIIYHNAGDERKKQVDKKSDELLSLTYDMKKNIVNASALTELAVSLFILISLIVGIALYINQLISIGSMIIAIVAIFGSFGPVIAISALPGNLTQTFASGDRVLNLIEEQPAVLPIENAKNMDFNMLEVKDLNFAYDKNIQVLKDINLQAQNGEIVGIVGESGCGKSTLLKLLLRFWQKDGGSIAYDSEDIENINTDSLLSNVTMVSQSTYLFDDTVEENLRLAKEDATPQEMQEACKKASVHDLIMSLPEGYSSRVGLSGDNLSAGEKQRIGLARAFLSGSKLILLDEPTSNVDSINEGIILQSLADQRKDKCIILVSHRLSTMAIADRVYTIKDGIISLNEKGE
ncbi:MAG: ABC transporter ATP-binding protein/permease [Clostridia bacterium]|nr:ABC transporter ATP-binding protein/permease [Clostridia bacterium]